jgi:hypothetical protein
MKKISIPIPCYNEEENVVAICSSIGDIMERDLSSYESNRDIFHWFPAVIFYRIYRRIYNGYKYKGNESATGH